MKDRMGRQREKAVRWIICFIVVALVSNAIFPLKGYPSEKYVIQLAASKSPLDIAGFKKRNRISDDITEIKSDNWYRYVTGDFKTLAEAREYAVVLKQKGLDVYPRNFYKIDGVEPPIPHADISVPEDSGRTKFNNTLNSDTVPVGRPDSAEIKVSSPDSINVNNNDSWILSLLFKEKEKGATNRLMNDFCDDRLPSFLQGFCHKVVKVIIQFPSVLILIFLILIFILNLAVVLAILYISNGIKNHKERHIRVYKKAYEEALLSYFFGLADWESTRSRLKYISEPLNRKILATILLSVQENLKGGFDEKMPEIFTSLGLQRDAIKLAGSRFYYKKIEGIRQLTYLYPDGALEIIPKYLNAKNDTVRAEAQTSYVRLHQEQPFGFFRELEKPFTRWTQLTAFHLLRLYSLKVDSFAEYLDSSHTNVRNFCLRMIIYFQQLESASEVLRMVESNVEMTRRLAYQAINNLRLYDGKMLLKEKFSTEPEKNRLEIIRAFRNIGSNEDFDFLLSIFSNGTISEKIESCRSLYFVSEAGQRLMESMCSEPELELDKYIDHITDPRN